MALLETIEKLDGRMENIESQLKDETIKRYKKKEWELPLGIKMRAKREIKKGKVLCVFMRANKQMEFKTVGIINGIIEIDKYTVNLFESDAVYIYKKTLPVIVVYEWRLLAVGGAAEKVNARVFGTKEDIDDADKEKIAAMGQRAIIRKMELIELEKQGDKKKGGKGLIFLLIGAGIILYIVASAMGWV